MGNVKLTVFAERRSLPQKTLQFDYNKKTGFLQQTKKPGFFNNNFARNKISYQHGDLRNPVSGGRIIIKTGFLMQHYY